MIRRSGLPTILAVGGLATLLTLASGSRAEEQGWARPNLTLRVMPPLAGMQTLRPAGFLFGNALGISGSLRLLDLVEGEFGYQWGVRCGSFQFYSQRWTGRVGVAPRVWRGGTITLRVPILGGFSRTTLVSHCDEGDSGHTVAGTLASGLDVTAGFFDVRLLVNGGLQSANVVGYFGDVIQRDSFTYGASLELGTTFDLGPWKDQRNE